MIRIRITQGVTGGYNLTIAGAGFSDSIPDLDAVRKEIDGTSLIALAYNAEMARWDVLSLLPF